MADNMNENEKWDDSEEAIMDIFEEIEDSKETQIPAKCPICHTYNAHIYMHRWENADFIDISELTSHPVFLESKAEMVDRHLRKLLENCH